MAKKDSSDEKAPSSGKGRVTSARAQLARVVGAVFTVLAVLLAIGALLIALKANEHNSVVKLVTGIDDAISGPFGRTGGVFTFHGKDMALKNALVNWGIAALVYLVIGRILSRLIRP